jgi:hypothetical protein
MPRPNEKCGDCGTDDDFIEAKDFQPAQRGKTSIVTMTKSLSEAVRLG